MWSKVFWLQTAERAIKTAAQTAAAMLSAEGLSIIEVNWVAIASVSAMSAFVCVLTSVASLPVGPDKTTPSVV